MVFVETIGGPLFILLTEQDCADMRGGRSKYVSAAQLKGRTFGAVSIGLFKNRDEIEDMMKKAGHAKALEGLPSPTPEPQQEECRGCGGLMTAYMLLHGKCIACWREQALWSSSGPAVSGGGKS